MCVRFLASARTTTNPSSASGEIWIKDNTTTLSCAVQENPNCSDSLGVFDAATGVSDHTGPYFGIDMGHAPFSTALGIRTSAPTHKNGARSVGATTGGILAMATVAFGTVAGMLFAL
ncbi:hypothetical protein C8R45DRAFT_1104489 [Mycena sanguinolenta]|nr:hypothetical protein C8R45DRAFT_1104489 [Mycena sanguinolenta]